LLAPEDNFSLYFHLAEQRSSRRTRSGSSAQQRQLFSFVFLRARGVYVLLIEFPEDRAAQASRRVVNVIVAPYFLFLNRYFFRLFVLYLRSLIQNYEVGRIFDVVDVMAGLGNLDPLPYLEMMGIICFYIGTIPKISTIRFIRTTS
jgi:hypothetical protein